MSWLVLESFLLQVFISMLSRSYVGHDETFWQVWLKSMAKNYLADCCSDQCIAWTPDMFLAAYELLQKLNMLIVSNEIQISTYLLILWIIEWFPFGRLHFRQQISPCWLFQEVRTDTFLLCISTEETKCLAFNFFVWNAHEIKHCQGSSIEQY